MERVGVPRTPMGLWIMLILYLRIRPQTIVGRLPKIPHGERRMCAICCGGVPLRGVALCLTPRAAMRHNARGRWNHSRAEWG